MKTLKSFWNVLRRKMVGWMTSEKPEKSSRALQQDIQMGMVSAVTAAKVGALAETALPGSGLAVAGLFQTALTEGVRYFREQNIKNLAEAVEKEAKKHNVDIEKLAHDQNFFRNVWDAQLAVLRDGRQEKIALLKNALLNSILSPPSTAKQQVFFQYIDQFTEWHIALLKFFEKPKEAILESYGSQLWNIEKSTSFVRVLGKIHPQLNGETETFLLQIWNALGTAGMIAVGPDVDFLNNRSEQKLFERRVTTFGQEFLRLISDPKPINFTTGTDAASSSKPHAAS